ncbi:MAG: tetratricopeptide repeat protein, partial [Steroidobacteraceae bacterium]|nr:tetratricopeptide repeat protein [Steroidobacteraceae bacterium]MDW8259795.1 tetratricopeptide repeat protein [Gammaproteobacteria bacterium]
MLLILYGAGLLVARSAVASEPPVADSALIEQAEQLLGAGEAAEALRLLRSREREFAGQPRFDYLLALAALDAKEPELAVAALERVLAVAPDFAGARLDLVRALQEAGREPEAQVQLSRVLAEQPSPATRATIEQYLTAGNAQPTLGGSASFSWFVDLGAGYDSNANGATRDTSFFGFPLPARFVATESPFGEIGLGFVYSAPYGTQAAVNGIARFTHRANPDAGFVDQTTGVLGAAYVRGLGAARLSVALHGSASTLDDTAFDRA